MSGASSIRFAARASATLGVTSAYLSRFEMSALTADRTEMVARWVPRWARRLLDLYGVELETVGEHIGEGRAYPGKAADGVGRVFVLNHRSAMDVMITFAFTEGRLVSRADLAQWPLVGGGARRIGTLFVDRASMRSGASVLKEMTRALQRGEAISIYPEGTAYPGDEVRKLRPGAFKAAQTAGAEIIPLGLAYDQPAAYYGDESFLDHAKRVASMKRLRAVLVAGDPVHADGRSVRELSTEVHDRLQELVHRARRRLEGK